MESSIMMKLMISVWISSCEKTRRGAGYINTDGWIILTTKYDKGKISQWIWGQLIGMFGV